MTIEHDVAHLADRLRAATRITVLTGAGVSAASGVPTFRGLEGLWRTYRPEMLATPEAFRADPRLVWEWYAWRRARVAACVPNTAHEVLGRWARERGAIVVTQNVDDLHVVAGTPGLVRLHGSLWELRCSGLPDPSDGSGLPAGRRPKPDSSSEFRQQPAPAKGSGSPCTHGGTPWADRRDFDLTPGAALPRCPHCGRLARPAIVWFGESLGEADVERAIEASACDIFLTVGTSALVHPAAGLVHEARRRGAWTAEINAEATPASGVVDLAIRGPAEAVLAQADQLARVTRPFNG
jgi:NAD-dependent SIR2 family protein deacetylase